MESKTKFIRTYKSDISTSIWYYDLSKFKNGPIKTEIEYAPGVLESMTTKKLRKEKKPKTVKQKAVKKTVKKKVNTNLGRFI
jgi:hypothetical protein